VTGPLFVPWPGYVLHRVKPLHSGPRKSYHRSAVRLSKFATGITEAFAKRNENIPVQNFDMGLDFSSIPTRVKLKEGAYIAVQVCDIASWDWSQWAYNVNNGTVVVTATPTKGVLNNYVVFSVSKIQ
jgi:hypothetical protein